MKSLPYFSSALHPAGLKTDAALTYLKDVLHHRESVTSTILNETFEKSELFTIEERVQNKNEKSAVSNKVDETSSEIGDLSDDEELDGYIRTEDQMKIVKPFLEKRLKEYEESQAVKGKERSYGKFKRKADEHL